MQTSHRSNQLSNVPQADPRMVDLRVWMFRSGVTFEQIGKALGGISGWAVHKSLKADRISHARHKEFTDFGIPAHLLPPAQDVPKGRTPKQ